MIQTIQSKVPTCYSITLRSSHLAEDMACYDVKRIGYNNISYIYLWQSLTWTWKAKLLNMLSPDLKRAKSSWLLRMRYCRKRHSYFSHNTTRSQKTAIPRVISIINAGHVLRAGQWIRSRIETLISVVGGCIE